MELINYAKAFTVSVTNVNEAPTDLSFEAPDVNRRILSCGGGGGGGGGDVGAGGGAGGFRTNKTGSQSEGDVLLKHLWLLQQELIL